MNLTRKNIYFYGLVIVKIHPYKLLRIFYLYMFLGARSEEWSFRWFVNGIFLERSVGKGILDGELGRFSSKKVA